MRATWQKFKLVVKVVELRLRFIALMAITGLTFAYWDTIANRYDKWMRPSAHAHAISSGIEYFCPMHPGVVRDQPGSCPICGMPLSRRKKGEAVVLPEGVTARVQLAPMRIEQAGIKTAEVVYAPLDETLTTVGTVEFDERRQAFIVSKIRGMARVEKLYVNFTGEDVQAGDTLAELYSPELYQAIQEMLLTRQSAQQRPKMQSTLGRSVLGDPNEMVHVAEEKLKLWGLTRAQIEEILKQGKSDYRIKIIAPIGGHVIKKNIVEGQYVSEGQAMFELADLHTVWVKAQVFEDEIGLVHAGQEVEATVDAFPGQRFPGRVAFMQPHLNASTRTVEVRYDLDNPDHKLRPGMFASVTLKTPVSETPMFRGRLVPVRSVEGEQKTCPVTNAKLGSMGPPVSEEVQGRKVWFCCESCPPKLKANPAKYLARLAGPPKDGVLSIPESAVIDTGTDKIVYVETEPGVFEGHKVVLGPRSGDRFPVLEGISPGEKVAAAGAFLIDAESRINPATRGSARSEIQMTKDDR
jgi:Cu(I)/Ag(I) efflux system membrane fusion protein